MEAVLLPETNEFLPRLGPGTTSTGPALWELPYPGVESELDRLVEEALTVGLRQRSLLTERQLVCLRGLPRPPRAGDLADRAPEQPGPDQDEVPCSWIAEELDLLVGLHVEAMQELCSSPPPSDGVNWGRADAVRGALRPLETALRAWTEAGQGDEPQMALIVRLARELRLTLPAVCHRPRVVLARDRQLQPVHRADQLDAACLRWLARQPGRTTIEKAGPRQRVLGIVRQEHCDTLENRVVRDLSLRALRAADLYIRQNRRFANHARVTGVRRFGSVLRRLLLESPISSARGLVGAPAPNYVLLHDPRYRPLWDAYLRLVRQQRLLDSAWRWQRRVWAETCLLATIAALLRLAGARLSYRSDVRVTSEHVAGCFIDPGSALSSVALGGDRHVDLVQGLHAAAHPESPVRRCAELFPDLLLVHRRGRAIQRVACIWALIWPTPQLPRLHQGAQGLVLVPRLPARRWHTSHPGRQGVGTIELPLPAQAGVEILADALSLMMGGGQ